MSSISGLIINLAKHHHRCLNYSYNHTIWRSLATQAINNSNSNNNNINNNNNNNNKASLDQLTKLEKTLALELPRFFSRPHNYNLYTRDILFIDNIRNIRIKGINKYVLQFQLIKLYYNVRYSSIKVELLNLVKNPEESYLKIRWRVITKPGLLRTVMFLFRPKKMDAWLDGISTMHVNKDGKIYCHLCDNIDVDTNDIDAKEKSSVKNPLVNRGLSVCNKHRV